MFFLGTTKSALLKIHLNHLFISSEQNFIQGYQVISLLCVLLASSPHLNASCDIIRGILGQLRNLILFRTTCDIDSDTLGALIQNCPGLETLCFNGSKLSAQFFFRLHLSLHPFHPPKDTDHSTFLLSRLKHLSVYNYTRDLLANMPIHVLQHLESIWIRNDLFTEEYISVSDWSSLCAHASSLTTLFVDGCISQRMVDEAELDVHFRETGNEQHALLDYVRMRGPSLAVVDWNGPMSSKLFKHVFTFCIQSKYINIQSDGFRMDRQSLQSCVDLIKRRKSQLEYIQVHVNTWGLTVPERRQVVLLNQDVNRHCSTNPSMSISRYALGGDPSFSLSTTSFYGDV